MSPQSELLMLIGMYVFIGLFLISLLKKTKLKTQLAYLVAEVFGYLLTRDIITITGLFSQEIQILFSITYLSLGFVGILHIFRPRKVNIMTDKLNFQQYINYKTQIETEPRIINLDTQSNKKQDKQDKQNKTLDSLIEDANKLLAFC